MTLFSTTVRFLSFAFITVRWLESLSLIPSNSLVSQEAACHMCWPNSTIVAHPNSTRHSTSIRLETLLASLDSVCTVDCWRAIPELQVAVRSIHQALPRISRVVHLEPRHIDYHRDQNSHIAAPTFNQTFFIVLIYHDMGIESAGGDSKPKPAPLRPAYKVEELLALRDSVSESAISLGKFGDEEAIKGESHHMQRRSPSLRYQCNVEHVLRPSVSHGQLATSAPESTEQLVGSENAPVVAHVTGRKKPSPTPSVQQRKAEKLIKEHGSPPGIRVTAGGRIVQTMFTPTGSPAMPKAKGNEFQQNKIHDEFMYPPNVALYPPPINHMGMMAPFVAAPYAQHAVMAMPPHGIAVPVQGPYPLPMVPIHFPNCPEPMISIDDAIASTNQRIKELEHALNLHEREMIFRDSFGRKMDQLEKKTAIERKREFVNQMNILRNQSKFFESEKANNILHVSPNLLLPQPDMRPRTPVLLPTAPAEAARKSHAVEIKKPQDAQKAAKSTLDPTSPSYEPKLGSPYTPGSENKAQESSSGDSTTTFSTTDFFPHNPEEHSMRKYKDPVSETQSEPSTSKAADEKRNSAAGNDSQAEVIISIRNGAQLRAQNPPADRVSVSEPTTKDDQKQKASRFDLDLKLKNKPTSYLQGYIHGLLQHQPDRAEGYEWVQGFCDGLTMSTETIEPHRTSHNSSFTKESEVAPGRSYINAVPVHYTMTPPIDHKQPENHRFSQGRYSDRVTVQPRVSSIPPATTRYGGSFAPRYPGDRGSGRSTESLHAVKGSGAWESKRNTPPMQSPAVTSLTGFAGNAASQAEGSQPSLYDAYFQQFRQILSLPPIGSTLAAALCQDTFPLPC